MGKVCMSCYESYGNEITNLTAINEDDGMRFLCPKRGCRGDVVEIDDILVPTIILLNQKGYYTESCCSGHLEDLTRTSYIIFNEVVEKLPSVPRGFRLSAMLAEEGQKRLTIAKHITVSPDSVIVFQDILNTALQMYAWAISLPYVDFDENEYYYEDKGFFEKDPGSEPFIDTEKMKQDIGHSIIPFYDYLNLLKNQNNSKPKNQDD
ncbi:hypothetical protein [Bacillus atrophaeus]|uniref:hypothetical protein n=1 Tax=Bacillus atrophaeus TaxID=1452 RepID=UPI002E1BD66E|nr:hypothetical protein [Bacillus atrophaeus]